jgi:tetratricopeptide (TPR) repeat protein
MDLPTICLNMIVKNENKIITRLFDSLCLGIIDSYCICDTGSTDDTIDVIETYFREKGIPGEVLVEPFQDFGYNRTFALEMCRGRPMADYILLLDADMILSYGANFDVHKFKQQLTSHPAHYVQQGHGEFFYKNVRLVKNNHGIKYWGVTHEYIDVPPGTTYGAFDMNTLYIDDIGDGGCKTDKFLRDVRLLTRALEQTPDNDRYTFYLANSYRDSGQKEKAIETYKKRAKLGGWNEEIWYSYFSIGRAYKELGDMERAVFYWLEAYNAFPDRIENLYEIVHYYRTQGKNELAYMFYRIADMKRGQMKSQCFDLLFAERDIYNFKLDYELSIVGYYTNLDKYDLAKCSMNLMAYPHIEHPTKNNIMSNYKFYAPTVDTAHSFLLTVESPDARFINSTPSICIHNGKYVVNTRYVNYRINEHGDYENQEKIETINVLSTYTFAWKKVGPDLIVQHDRSRDNYYVGLEDIRLFSSSNGKLMYNANRGTAHGISVEHGEIDIVTGNTTKSVVLTKREVEKNWVLFEDGEGNMKCIYEWYPLTIGDIRDGAFHATHESRTSRIFEGFRGSTNGVHIGDEIWFLCHVVSYESRRYYYHVMVALDKTTLKITRYTPLFTFTKECVEYTLGFTYKDGTLLIGYSTMDRTTRYVHVKKTWFDAMFARLGFTIPGLRI